jgi:uncharacterized membrane protein YeaQ/YmgE (transglycosylase-associated protein family)
MALTLGVFNFFSVNCVGWVVAGLIGGWLAGKIVQGKGYGCFVDILLGLAGAFLAAIALQFIDPFHFANTTYGFIGTTVLAFVGALILAFLGKLVGGGSSNKARP